MSYTPYVWHDGTTGGTLVTAARLNALEQAVGAASAPADGVVYVTDYASLTAALTAAVTDAAFTRVTVVAGSTIVLTNSNRLTIDVGYVHVDFQGCLVDGTGLTAGVAVTVTGSTNPPYQQATNGFSYLRLLGPGRAVAGVTGVLFAGPTSATDLSGPSHVQPQHVNLSGFETNVSYGNHSYLIDHQHWDVYRGGTGIKVPAGLTDAGERYAYTGCNIFNNTTGVDAQLAGADLFFHGGSLDYNTDAQIKNAGAQIHLQGVHVENGAKTTPDFTVTGNGATIHMVGGTFANTGPASWQAAILNNAASGGGVFLDGVHLSGLNSASGYLATGTGLTVARDTTGYDIATTCYTVAATSNLLADGDFEAASIVDRWAITADTATIGAGNQFNGTNIDLAVSTDFRYNASTQSLKATKTGGAGTAAGYGIAVPIPRGQRARLRLYYKPNVTSGTVSITASYAAVSDNPVNGLPRTATAVQIKQSLITLTAGTPVWTVWQLTEPTVRAPMWATHITLDVSLTSMAAGSFYLDAVEVTTL